MQIYKQCWKCNIVSANKFSLYEQQMFKFKEKPNMGGVFTVVEVNTYKPSSEAEIHICTFPSFFKSYLGCLIYCHSLYIYMWKEHQLKKFNTYPGHTEVFKHIHQMLNFTNEVVMKCIGEATKANVDANWIPVHPYKWLIIKFKVGSHKKENADHLIQWHHDNLSDIDPTQFGK